MRDAAWQAYRTRHEHNWDRREAMIAKVAFAAGQRAAVNQEPKMLDTGSLFPTVGVDDAN